jgi:hypothetical protein
MVPRPEIDDILAGRGDLPAIPQGRLQADPALRAALLAALRCELEAAADPDRIAWLLSVHDRLHAESRPT